MSYAFPTLDSLRPHLPKAEVSTEWVGMLASVPTPAPKASGWTPPALVTTMEVQETVDLEAIQQAAQEAGFRAGYAEGQAAGAERGYAEGLRSGREDGREAVIAEEASRIVEFREALSGAAAEVVPAVQAWQASVEERATELAMNAVRALLAAELATQRPDAMGIVREALGFAEGAIKATIRMAPFDRAALAERREEILAACAGLRDVELVDDRSIDGGCVIETESGVVDASLATRLSLLEAA